MDNRREALRRRLADLGFDEVRFAALASVPSGGLREWLAAGHHADMKWMERTAEKRLDPQLVLPGARSIILLGINYWRRGGGSEDAGRGRPVWARYALYDDYHEAIEPALARAGEVLQELYGIGGADYRYYVDTGPVLERGWAARSGVGFVGKNAMLISRSHGNWLFLAAILTRQELAADPPLSRGGPRPPSERETVGLLCGKCTRCIDACPTDAFVRPGVVDARRCISYQTIENRGMIPRSLREGIGSRIFGCDVCLDVCPWNRFAGAGRQLLLAARGDIAAMRLDELLQLTPDRFREIFGGTPVARLKLAGLLRNACVAAGNSGDVAWLASLASLAAHAAPVVRAHAVWAVFRLAGRSRASVLLRDLRRAETDPDVLAEYAAED